MNKTNVILICIVVALLSGIVGFIIGINTKLSFDNSNNDTQLTETTDSKSIVGTYKTNTWNGKEAVLVIKEDGTMIYPTGQRCTWIYENGHLYIPSTTEPGEEKRQELELVDGGIMINTHFFEKVK